MTNLKINIPSPCSMDWNKMMPNENGKYCNSCSKIVVDFTSMKDEEIRDYFKSYSNKRICGHFKTSQIKKKDKNSYFISLHDRFTRLKLAPIRYACLILLGFVMTLAGCYPSTQGEVMITGDTTAVETSDTVNQDSSEIELSGETTLEN